MKLKLLAALPMALCFTGIFAQGITKTATGEGTVLLKGSSIGIDVGKTDFTFGMNNLQNSVGKNELFIFGANVKGENKEGLSSIFSKGAAVPSGTLHGFAGVSFSNATHTTHEVSRKLLLLRQEQYTYRFIKDFKSQMYYAANGICTKATQAALKKSVQDGIKTVVFIEEIGELLESAAADHADVATAKIALLLTYDSLKKEFDQKTKDFETALKNLETLSGPKKYWQAMAYGFGSYSSTQFKRFTTLDPVNYGNSFEDINSKGYKIGGGLNLQYANIMFGFTYAGTYTNNFAALSKKAFTYKKNNETGTQSLVETKEITAYSGNYGSLHMGEYAMDVIINVGLDKEFKNHLLVNPYIRINSSNDKTLLPTSTNLGAGFYFFQQTGKFLGGFYVELPDANNNFERMKPEADQKIKPAMQRLNFGLVGKLSLSSFLGIL